MNDLLIKNCIDFEGNKTDILIKDGYIKENSTKIKVENICEIGSGFGSLSRLLINSFKKIKFTIKKNS